MNKVATIIPFLLCLISLTVSQTAHADHHHQVLNIQSDAFAFKGRNSLSIPSYTVPVDGILVVRGGAWGPTVQTVRFNGVDMNPVASMSQPYWLTISADMYWLPVTAGQSGTIEWNYSSNVQRMGLIAMTLSGVDQLGNVQTFTVGQSTVGGPNLAEHQLTTTEDSIILSGFTSNGAGPSALTGPGHILDAFPTVPITDFHSTRVYGGHVISGPGTHTLGFQNTEAISGWFHYILILAEFRAGMNPNVNETGVIQIINVILLE